jgi:hypothetical protein
MDRTAARTDLHWLCLWIRAQDLTSLCVIYNLITINSFPLTYFTIFLVVAQFPMVVLLHYITLHYITLHYVTLHYVTLHYITLHYVNYIRLRYVTLHYITFVTLHYITLRYVTLRYITLSYVTLRYITLHYITLHYITLHYITLHYITHWYNNSICHFLSLCNFTDIRSKINVMDSFIYPTDGHLDCSINVKIYIKIYMRGAPTFCKRHILTDY